MPYQSLNDLPDKIRNNIPKHAQEIYKAAFNNAWEEYKQPENRKNDTSREETAHKVAWKAVKQKYHKEVSGKWVRN